MNPKLGDVGFKAGGRSYVLNMGINALCAVEYEAKCSSTELLERVFEGLRDGRMRVSDIRTLFWAGLQRHHPEMDKDTAGDLMQVMGRGDRKALDLIQESMRLCSPDPEPIVAETEAGEDAQLDPPPAPDGTGTGSS